MGSFSSIIFLFGVSFIYGVSGTIVLTDLKDLFLWIFSFNSFFLSFESLSKGLTFFEIETFFNHDNESFAYYRNFSESSAIKIKSIYNKFILFRNQTSYFEFLNVYFYNQFSGKGVTCLEYSINLIIEKYIEESGFTPDVFKHIKTSINPHDLYVGDKKNELFNYLSILSAVMTEKNLYGSSCESF
jgi:hypothetical protein